MVKECCENSEMESNRQKTSQGYENPDLVFFYSEPLVDSVFDEKKQK